MSNLAYLKFVLQTISITYPRNPNDVSKKKYYTLIQNLPVFFPLNPIGKNFKTLLDKYPVTPYLESRQSLVRWTHFIHNKINKALNLPTLTMEQAMSSYYESYKPREVKDLEQRRRREKYVFAGFVVLVIAAAAYLYRK